MAHWEDLLPGPGCEEEGCPGDAEPLVEDCADPGRKRRCGERSPVLAVLGAGPGAQKIGLGGEGPCEPATMHTCKSLGAVPSWWHSRGGGLC